MTEIEKAVKAVVSSCGVIVLIFVAFALMAQISDSIPPSQQQTAQASPPSPASNATTQGGLQIETGQLSQLYPEIASQAVSVKNTTIQRMKLVYVSCGFFQGGKLMTTGYGVIADLAPGEIAFANVTGTASDVDRTQCRISSAS
jgi:hypothetical protein